MRRAVRARYTWHMRLPFKDHFDRSHWWEGKGRSEIEPRAALYELARRHPLIRDQWVRRIAAIRRNRRALAIGPGHPFYGKGRFSRIILEDHWFQTGDGECSAPSLSCTCLFGLKSWAMLDWTTRRNWETTVGHLKGLDFRWEELQCRSINVLADWKIRDQREDALGDKVKGKRRGAEVGAIINADLATNPPTPEEWEAAIGYRSIEAYRQGYLLLAVAPDLQMDKAVSLMKRVYGSTRRRYASPKQRARWENWLPLITSFEDAELSHKAYAQEFARYRRALDSLHFA